MVNTFKITTNLDLSNFNVFTKTAVKAALAGGEVLKKHFSKGVKVELKGRIDPVTIADKSSQIAIEKTIKKVFPDHSFIGEEGEANKICSKYCWIVDPLDGTVNFIHNLPAFCVSVGFCVEGEPVSGVVYAPLLEEIFIAQKGKGSYFNGKRIHVSKTKELIGALVVTGFPYSIKKDLKPIMNRFSNVITQVQGLRRLGSAALDLAYVGCGRFEAFWEDGLRSWDVAAGSLIVKEAGGFVSDYKGGKNYLFGKKIVASNKILHKKMMRLI